MKRTSSSGAEYGLFEGEIVDGSGEVNVKDSNTGKTSQHYFERVAEICLTRKEAEELGFGYPD